jgi:glyoxylase-like metal-dependent hydrolase (beta-lactamase superfamily II)
MMHVKTFCFNQMDENCHLIWDNADGTAVVVDPGCATAAEREALQAFIAAEGLRPAAALLTHLHFDHLAGSGWLRERYGIDCYVHEADRDLEKLLQETAHVYDFRMELPVGPFRYFAPEERELRFGAVTVRILPLGGHTRGSVAYYFPDAGAVCVGDTVRKGTLGFLETGFAPVLEALRDYLLPLPEDTRMLPGHGEASTLGEERRENRFFRRSLAL